MSDIVLTPGIRQNLLSLQNTAALMATTQNRLATGKKVNSALDNPVSFFMSQSLNDRANDLSNLLDSIGQAQQTLQAANQGITALTTLVNSAKSLATQARQSTAPAATYTNDITGNVAIADDVSRSTATTAFASASIGASDTLTITQGATTKTFTYVASGASASAGTFTSLSDLKAAINDNTGGFGAATDPITATDDGAGGHLILNSSSAGSFTVGGSAASKLGLSNSALANDTLGSLSGVLSITVGSGAAQTIDFSTVKTKAALTTALGNLTGVTGTIDGTGHVKLSSTTSDTITISGTNTAASGLFAAGDIGAHTATATITTPNATRTSLQANFNDLLGQIDQLAADSSYNGINLINGDTLKVVFNENGTSFLNIPGVTLSAAGLGLTALTGDEFQNNNQIDTVVGKINDALAQLRAQASAFGSVLTTVQTRQSFTKNLITTLQTGSDNLVLADTNEEGANLLALQTRQSLSTTALSLANQASQAVLRLFG